MSSRPSPRRALLTLAGALLALGPAAAPLAGQIYVGQSFTVPTPGDALLQQITAPAASHFGTLGNGPYTASLFAYSGGALIGPSLFTQLLGDNFAGYTLTPNVTLAGGGLYALVIGSATGGQTTTSAGNTLPGGEALTCFPAPNCVSRSGPGNDITGFAVQFGAATTPVPEPATLALLGTGRLAVVGVAARRRRA